MWFRGQLARHRTARASISLAAHRWSSLLPNHPLCHRPSPPSRLYPSQPP